MTQYFCVQPPILKSYRPVLTKVMTPTSKTRKTRNKWQDFICSSCPVVLAHDPILLCSTPHTKKLQARTHKSHDPDFQNPKNPEQMARFYMFFLPCSFGS